MESLRGVASAVAAPYRIASTRELLGIVLEACRGLNTAHAKRPRPARPQTGNMFVVTRDDGTQSTRILDVGLVQLRDENSSWPGSLIGAVKFMSPERSWRLGALTRPALPRWHARLKENSTRAPLRA
jgi:hypothetical protein